MSSRGDYEERAGRNDASRNHADHHGQSWTDSELEMLTELWDGTEETLAELAEILGRTIEACRQRYYTRDATVTHRVTRTVTVNETVVASWLVGWLYGTCSRCQAVTDVYSDGRSALCEDCR